MVDQPSSRAGIAYASHPPGKAHVRNHAFVEATEVRDLFFMWQGMGLVCNIRSYLAGVIQEETGELAISSLSCTTVRFYGRQVTEISQSFPISCASSTALCAALNSSGKKTKAIKVRRIEALSSSLDGDVVRSRRVEAFQTDFVAFGHVFVPVVP